MVERTAQCDGNNKQTQTHTVLRYSKPTCLIIEIRYNLTQPAVLVSL